MVLTELRHEKPAQLDGRSDSRTYCTPSDHLTCVEYVLRRHSALSRVLTKSSKGVRSETVLLSEAEKNKLTCNKSDYNDHVIQ
jgi:hypothetical protein